MKIDPHIETAAHAALAAAVRALLERQLGAEQIAYIWPESHRIRIRTADGRTGDVEVLVSWDVVVDAQEGNAL
jgi:hypothetical protein